jgi:hypothetical protein
MRGPQAALEAMAAHYVAFGGDQIPYCQKIVPGSRTQLRDPAGELMPYHDRRLEPVSGPVVPLPDVEVGTADAGVMYLDQRFVRPAGGDRHVPKDDTGTCGLFHEGAHGGRI